MTAYTPARGRYSTITIGASDRRSENLQSSLDYDRVCDGVDDHAEIQAAIDALASTGGRVVLSEGNFYSTSTSAPSITLADNVTLEGQGSSTVLTWYRHVDTIKIDGVSNAAIRNMKLVTTGGGNNPRIKITGVSDNNLIENIWCDNSAGGNSAAIYLDGTNITNTTIQNILIKTQAGGVRIAGAQYTKLHNIIHRDVDPTGNTSWMSFYFESDAAYIQADNLVSRDSIGASGGAVTVVADHVELNNIFVYNNKNANGISLGGSYINLSNFHIDTTAEHGLGLNNDIAVQNYATVSNGIIEGATDKGILLQHNYHFVTFSNLVLRNNADEGIRIGGSAEHIAINNCVFDDNMTGGGGAAEIQIGGYDGGDTKDVVISNCTINNTKSGESGIFVTRDASPVREVYDLVITGCNINVNGGLPISAVRAADYTRNLLNIYNNQGADSSDTYSSEPLDEIRTAWAKNTSGGTLTKGSVVVMKAVADRNRFEFDTTTSQGDDHIWGVLREDVANNAFGPVQWLGLNLEVKVDGTADIAVNDFLGTFTTAGIAMKAAAGDMAFAVALEAYATDDSNGVIDALLITPRKI